VTRAIYAWVIDGLGEIFVSDEGLDDAWAIASGFERTLVGLRDLDLPVKINLRMLGLDQTPVSIEVDDLAEGDPLAPLFGTARETADDLVSTIDPADDPAPASVWGKHVGLERIGPAGERRRFSCIPAFAAGLQHLGQNDAFAVGSSPSPVSDGPVLWDGRRCAVYRVTYDAAAGAFEPLAAAKRIWWGRLRGRGRHDAKRWAFDCFGPRSWHSGDLATGNFQDPLRVLAVTTLVDDGLAGPTILRGELSIRRLGTKATDAVFHTYVTSVDASHEVNMGTVTGYDAVASAVNAHLASMIAEVANGAAYDANGNDLVFSTLKGSDGITFRWAKGDNLALGDPVVDNTLAVSSYTAQLYYTLHEDAWRLLGYDVRQQKSSNDPATDTYGKFSKVGSAGYWRGWFVAANARAVLGYETDDFGEVVKGDYDSGGQGRRWPPLYSGGTYTLTGEAGQEIQLDTPDPVRLTPSRSRPAASAPGDPTTPYSLGGGVGPVDAQGVLILQGPYRRRGDLDDGNSSAGYAFNLSRERQEGRTIQLARVAWASAGSLVAADADGLPRLVIMEWIEPRLAGFDYEPLDGTWGGYRDPPEGAEPIMARPLAMWDYSSTADKSTTVLQRLLATTGTSGGWYADPGLVTEIFGLDVPTAYLDRGANDLGGDIPSDADSAPMGFAIPASMIAAPELWDAAGSIPGPHLSRCKVVSRSSASGEELVRRLLAPTGIALGLSGGRYTPFDAWSFPAPDEAAVTLTAESYALTAGRPPTPLAKQALRLWAPIDQAVIRGRIEPLALDYAREVARAATDAGAGSRSQQIVERVDGDHLIHPQLDIDGGSWQFDIQTRWPAGFAFWGQRHTVVTVPVCAEVGLDLWPGDAGLITDPWLLDTLGAYGVSLAAFRVIGRRPSTKTEIVKLTLLVAAETDWRRWGPSAAAVEYLEGGPWKLICEDDHLGDRGGELDVDGFIEPAWSSEGGDADVEVFSFGDAGWRRGIYGTVTGVESGPSALVLAGALTGPGLPWRSDEHHLVVLREWGSQTAAWVTRIHAPTCAEDGTHTGGQPGIKWRGL
jgi:hypothetical protein